MPLPVIKIYHGNNVTETRWMNRDEKQVHVEVSLTQRNYVQNCGNFYFGNIILIVKLSQLSRIRGTNRTV